MKEMDQSSRAGPLKSGEKKKGRPRRYHLGGRLMVLATATMLGAFLGLSLYSTVRGMAVGAAAGGLAALWSFCFVDRLIRTGLGSIVGGLAGLIIGAVAMLAYDGDRERALVSLQGPQPIKGAQLAGLPPVGQMVRQIREVREDGHPIELIIVRDPHNSGGITAINMLDDSILDSRYSLIFRNSGAFVETYGGEGAPAGLRALAMLQPLHFGTFGGYPIKFLYFVMALALTWVTSSGMKIWFSRREQQGRAVPRMRAAWHGMTAGLTLGLAGACPANLSGSVDCCDCSISARAFPLGNLLSGCVDRIGNAAAGGSRHCDRDEWCHDRPSGGGQYRSAGHRADACRVCLAWLAQRRLIRALGGCGHSTRLIVLPLEKARQQGVGKAPPERDGVEYLFEA